MNKNPYINDNKFGYIPNNCYLTNSSNDNEQKKEEDKKRRNIDLTNPLNLYNSILPSPFNCF